MANVNVVTVLSAATLASGGAGSGKSTSATIIAQPTARDYGDSLLHHHLAEVVVNVDVGAGAETVSFGLEVSDDGTTWYSHRFLDLETALYESATQVVYTADASKPRMLYEGGWRYVRVSATNSGANTATINLVRAIVEVFPS